MSEESQGEGKWVWPNWERKIDVFNIVLTNWFVWVRCPLMMEKEMWKEEDNERWNEERKREDEMN